MTDPLDRRLAMLGMSLFSNENKNLIAEAVEAVHERDAALAVIEQVGRALTESDVRYEERNRNAFAILAQSPASALAKVKADAIREAAKHLDEMDADSTHIRTLLAEADRIEKEAQHEG